MSSQVDEKLQELADLYREAEGKLVTLQFDNEQLRRRCEELERELALADERLEKLGEARRD